MKTAGILVLLALPFLLLCALPLAQTNSLIGLYNATNGAGWTNQLNWNNGNPCGPPAWFGIICDASGDNVAQIILENNNLVGTVPNLVFPQLTRL
jgi:hypothetical protein